MTQQRIITNFTALVWILNGLFCKILNLVPRHEQIVSRILGNEYSHTLTLLIGISEIGMALWVLSRFKSRINALTQISLVLTMNIIEISWTPDLLLWGKFNIVFALLFTLLVYYNEFILTKPKTT